MAADAVMAKGNCSHPNAVNVSARKCSKSSFRDSVSLKKHFSGLVTGWVKGNLKVSGARISAGFSRSSSKERRDNGIWVVANSDVLMSQ